MLEVVAASKPTTHRHLVASRNLLPPPPTPSLFPPLPRNGGSAASTSVTSRNPQQVTSVMFADVSALKYDDVITLSTRSLPKRLSCLKWIGRSWHSCKRTSTVTARHQRSSHSLISWIHLMLALLRAGYVLYSHPNSRQSHKILYVNPLRLLGYVLYSPQKGGSDRPIRLASNFNENEIQKRFGFFF